MNSDLTSVQKVEITVEYHQNPVALTANSEHSINKFLFLKLKTIEI